jgi:hypothetical protein
MNINFCNLIFERRRNGNDIFSLQKLLPKLNLLSFSTLLFRDGGNIVGVFRNFLFEAEAVSIEQIAVLVVFRGKKCSFKSMSRFAVVEFEDIDVTSS